MAVASEKLFSSAAPSLQKQAVTDNTHIQKKKSVNEMIRIMMMIMFMLACATVVGKFDQGE